MNRHIHTQTLKHTHTHTHTHTHIYIYIYIYIYIIYTRYYQVQGFFLSLSVMFGVCVIKRKCSWNKRLKITANYYEDTYFICTLLTSSIHPVMHMSKPAFLFLCFRRRYVFLRMRSVFLCQATPSFTLSLPVSYFLVVSLYPVLSSLIL